VRSGEAQEVRSTWLTSSLDALRRHGYLEAYRARLPAQHHDPIFHMVAGSWLPASLAYAHYCACDALEITPQQHFAMGAEVGAFAHRAYIAVALQAARGMGVTPFTFLDALPKLWTRMWRGGELSTHREGPKDARIDIRDWAIAPIPYVRGASRGVLTALAAPLAAKVYVSELKSERGRNFSCRVAWV
jgi:hypothetical protein